MTTAARLMVDVSSYQPATPLLWDELKAAGVEAAMIRVWSGTRPDMVGLDHRNLAQKRGIRAYPYFVAHPAMPPAGLGVHMRQLTRVGGAWDTLPLGFAGSEIVPAALDWELPGLTAAWYEELCKVYAPRVVYSSASSPPPAPPAGHPLPRWWVAAWGADRAPRPASTVAGDLFAWQYAAGVSSAASTLGRVDRSHLYVQEAPMPDPTPTPPPYGSGRAIQTVCEEILNRVNLVESKVNTIGEQVSELVRVVGTPPASSSPPAAAANENPAAVGVTTAGVTITPHPSAGSTTMRSGWQVPEPAQAGVPSSSGEGWTAMQEPAVPAAEPAEPPAPADPNRTPDNPASSVDVTPHDEQPAAAPPAAPADAAPGDATSGAVGGDLTTPDEAPSESPDTGAAAAETAGEPAVTDDPLRAPDNPAAAPPDTPHDEQPAEEPAAAPDPTQADGSEPSSSSPADGSDTPAAAAENDIAAAAEGDGELEP